MMICSEKEWSTVLCPSCVVIHRATLLPISGQHVTASTIQITWLRVAEYSGFAGRNGTVCLSLMSIEPWFCVDSQTDNQTTHTIKTTVHVDRRTSGPVVWQNLYLIRLNIFHFSRFERRSCKVNINREAISLALGHCNTTSWC